MANKVILSEQFKLSARDFLKGGIIAVVSAIFPIIQASLSQGELTFNWKSIGVTAVGAFVAYIGKNFLEPAKVITTYNNNQHAAAVASDIKNPTT
jgi:hypothetical protein